MKSLSEYLAYYDPMRESNERYLPEDQATLRYSRVSVIADGKVIGASLYPDHVLDLAFLETPFMRQLCRDYQYARKLKVRIECYEHSGEGEGRGLVRGDGSMFIWDFVADTVLGQIVDWIYGQMIGFLGNFFSLMGQMGAELFELDWIQAIVLFYSQLAWVLYVVGLVVAVFECAIECQSGRGSVRDTALNALKGFMAAGLFSVVPVELYKFSVSLQGEITRGITGLGGDFGSMAGNIIDSLANSGTLQDAMVSGVFGGINTITNPILMIFILFMMGYSTIKVFFANLKRGGILLIQIAVGSLYLFSVPRGYIDGFTNWCKQVIGICLTAFLQATMLIAGLMVLSKNALLGLGIMLAAGEVPRIAGQFGLDTSTRANLMSSVYAAQSAVNLTRTIVQVAAK